MLSMKHTTSAIISPVAMPYRNTLAYYSLMQHGSELCDIIPVQPQLGHRGDGWRVLEGDGGSDHERR